MVLVRKKFGPLTMHECWNDLDRSLPNHPLSLYSFFNIHTDVPVVPGLIVKEYKTVCNDLRMSEEDMFSAFTKQTRNVIRQTQSMEIAFNMSTSVQIFVPFFNAFARKMGIKGTSLRKLSEYGSNMIITSASLNDTLCAAHSYILDRESKTVVLYQSASRRLIASDVDKGLVGKVNKSLHFQDMKFFKNMGFHLYDFGGYFEKTETDGEKKRGVNDFKLLFGGQIVTYNNLYTPSFWYLNSLRLIKSKCYQALSKVVDKIKTIRSQPAQENKQEAARQIPD